MRVGPGGVPRRLREHLQPRRAAAVRRPERRAPARTASRCSTTPRPTPSAPRSARWAPAPRCWSTPTTCARQCALASRSPGPGWAPYASTPATSACWPTGCASELDDLGATKTRIVVTSDLDEYAIAALAAAPVDGYGVGTQLVTGSGHPTCGFVYKLVAREGDDGAMVSVAKKSVGQDLHRRPQVRAAPARRAGRRRGRGDRHRHSARQRRQRPFRSSSSWSATARSSAASRSTPPAPGTRAARAELPWSVQQMSKGEPVIPTILVGVTASEGWAAWPSSPATSSPTPSRSAAR